MKKELVSEALSRAGALLFVSDLLRTAGPDQWAFLISEQTRATWITLSGALELPKDMGLPRNRFLFDAVYVATFEAGTPDPPVPLVESFYDRTSSLTETLHANTLFYSAFDLSLPASGEQAADHLSTQLEFLAYTYRLECSPVYSRDGSADERDERLNQIRRVRRDYMVDHILNWLPGAAARAEQIPDPWISRFLRAAERLVGALASEKIDTLVEV